MRFNNKNVILPEPWEPTPVGPPNDELWYTSSNGSIVTPTSGTLPTIVSNTYVDGKGIIKCASNITSIGYKAFKNKSLKSVTIPNGVTSIGSRAFENCISMKSVTIGNGVTSIGSNAFSDCTGLTKVNITDIATWCNIAFDNSYSNPLNYARHLFINDVEVSELVIPNSVTSIKNYVFYKCSSLTSVTIPNSVTTIGEYAFFICTSLNSISYTGTIAQYSAITKGTNWNLSVPATVVHCTDGDIPI